MFKDTGEQTAKDFLEGIYEDIYNNIQKQLKVVKKHIGQKSWDKYRLAMARRMLYD